MERSEILERFRQVVAPYKGIEVKGKKMPYTALNGNMFSFIDDEDCLCLRVSEQRKADLNAKNGTQDVIQYGSVMRGYVQLPDAISADASQLAAYFKESLEFAKTLKPKPTKTS